MVWECLSRVVGGAGVYNNQIHVAVNPVVPAPGKIYAKRKRDSRKDKGWFSI